MTELQAALIGSGLVVVMGVAAYNKWQEYRHRKLAERILDSRHADVLMRDAGPDGAEPGVDDSRFLAGKAQVQPSNFGAAGHCAASASAGQRLEPVLCPADSEEPADIPDDPLTTPATSRFCEEPADCQGESERPPVSSCDGSKDRPGPRDLLSPLIDYIVSFESVEPVSSPQILQAQRHALVRLSKPIHWVGYNERAKEWEILAEDEALVYRKFRIGIQLVDRHGVLSDTDLSVFHVAMQDLADEMMAVADFPSRQMVLEEAVRLDRFCADVDIQIGVNVISLGQSFPGTKLRGLAESAGMVIDSEGRFVRCDDDGNVLYLMLNQEECGFSVDSMKTLTTHGLTFLLDVPRVAHGDRVFSQMVDLARRFADVLRGALVDDNRRPLSEEALLPIRRQIAHYQSQMAAQGLPAGSFLAQRLFS